MNQTVHNTNNYSLSIRFSPDGFSLFIYDENNINISKKSISAKINQLSETEIIDLLSKEPELQLNYKSVRLICETISYTVIPSVFFKNEEIADMLKFQHPELPKNEIVLYNFLDAWDAVNIFSLPKSLSVVLQQLLPEITIEHHLTTFLTDYIAMQNEKCLHIWIRSSEMDIVGIQNNHLQLINTYNYSTPEDFIYYTMNAIQQLGFNAEDCKVLLYNSEKAIELHQLLSKYVTKCEIVNELL
ncbi:MAG: DUF3822 family protein [Paludibacter sp.]|nr:DUF3822 family protein [Paludibacter sp.]